MQPEIRGSRWRSGLARIRSGSVSGDPDGFGPFARPALDATWAGRSVPLALVVTDRNVADLP